GQFGFEHGATPGEEVNEGVAAAGPGSNRHIVGQFAQRRSIAPGRIDDRDPRPGLDAELCYKRTTRVASHRPIGRNCRADRALAYRPPPGDPGSPPTSPHRARTAR